MRPREIGTSCPADLTGAEFAIANTSGLKVCDDGFLGVELARL
jgi:hypothetical protein